MFRKVKALSDVSFEINKYQFVAILGNNGSGKSTTLNLLANLFQPDKGDIYISDQKINYKSTYYKKQFGFVLTNPAYIDSFSIWEYLSFVCKFHKIDRKIAKQRMTNLIDYFNLNSQANVKIQDLSKGNKAKVCITGSLLHDPSVLVFDEPYVNLDIEGVIKLQELLASFKSRKTIVIASHSLDLVAELCDRFLIMDNGKIGLDIDKSNFNNLNDLKDHVKDNLKSNKSMKEVEWLK